VNAAGPGGAEGETKPPGDDTGEYVRRMRSLPASEVIGEALVGLIQVAQAKVGRRDARLLIDVTAVAHEHARPYLPGDLTSQIDQVLGQLRLAQVSAEGNASQRSQPEENDLDRAPAPPPASPAP
jgi:hypothetical protein